MWHRTGTISLKTGTNKVLGVNTKWLDKLSNVEAGQPLIVNNNIYEITEVKSDTELYIKELALEDVANSSYVIMSVVYGSLGDVALKASKALAHYQEQMQVFDQMYSGTEPFTVIKPDGTEIEMYPYSLLSVNLQDLNQTIQTVANYAMSAESSASHAQSSASEAGQYALNASNSAKQSEDSAVLSAETASKALQSANDSASSASNASQSASQAKQSEEAALTHANKAQASAIDSAQSASESKASAEEAKQAMLGTKNGFNKDLLIQEFEQLSDEEKQVIKDHLKIEVVDLTGYMKGENNLSDVKDKDQAKKNLGIVDPIAPDLTGLLAKENNLSDVPDKAKARSNLGITTPDLSPLLNKTNNLSELTDKKKALENLGGFPKVSKNTDDSNIITSINDDTTSYYTNNSFTIKFEISDEVINKSGVATPEEMRGFDWGTFSFYNYVDFGILPNIGPSLQFSDNNRRNHVVLGKDPWAVVLGAYDNIAGQIPNILMGSSIQYGLRIQYDGVDITISDTYGKLSSGYALTINGLYNKKFKGSFLFVAKTSKPTGWNDGADIAGPNLTPVQAGTWTIVSQFDTGATGNRYVYLFVRKY